MGSCLSFLKKKETVSTDGNEETNPNLLPSTPEQGFDNQVNTTENENTETEISFGQLRFGNDGDSDNEDEGDSSGSEITAQRLHSFVLDVLHYNEHFDPTSSMILQGLAESETGWMIVVMALVISIPLNHSGGPSCISMVLKESPLPTKDATSQLTTHLINVCHAGIDNEKARRNSCIVIGCLANMLGGQHSIILLNSQVMELLISQLSTDTKPGIILYALNALEKLAQSAENKSSILQALETSNENPILKLEKWAESEDFEMRQVGFCAQWLLDNIFLVNGRPFGYELISDNSITVTLNSDDVTPYLKISPNGLEARCDVSSFESVRCTFQVDQGAWYYEVLLVTDGLMQIGWATKKAAYLNLMEGGYGIGDDEFSVGFDGYRKLLWHGDEPEAIPTMTCWKSGDIVGAFIDLDALEVIFYLNGEVITTHHDMFNHARTGFFAAASFGIFQQCQFNFGNRPFAFPPAGKAFNNFNDHAKSDSPDECKVILPRHLKMKEYLRTESVQENVCKICVDNISDIKFLPCEHTGVCSICTEQLDICPFCREAIAEKVWISESS